MLPQYMYMYTGPDRKLNRAKFIDYSLPGFYYVTINTQNKIHWFGDVRDGVMMLNKYGGLAHIFMQMIPTYYNNVNVDSFQIMPNHIHGIIRIVDIPAKPTIPVTPVRTGLNPVPTRRYGQISKIIHSYKRCYTNTIRTLYNNHNFQWKRSFHDRLLRNQSELEHSRWYIRNNPTNWNNIP